jgi:hypothetical protein
MAEHPNVSLHRKGHDAFRSGDIDTLSGLFAEDTVWHWPGRSEFGGEFRGRDAILELLGRFGQRADALEFVDQEFLANDTHTSALSHMKATREGNTLEFDLCEVVRWRDGQVAEEWLLIDDQYAFDEFFAEPFPPAS